eukprot:CAMPEP_0181328096 /NCGR_PEP_ID=MMETSP1101-20121128/22498_1 /TAXON_ID=46948 /ORGANISM="Rhodomonas abbreviata, Strain Caron Lab Isolate" /LENGTH=913 /DNA_ID=CAMNT_0023436891 /DNA_START=153 /DNA_END=2894 /DNA_ORIENTATION=+
MAEADAVIKSNVDMPASTSSDAIRSVVILYGSIGASLLFIFCLARTKFTNLYNVRHHVEKLKSDLAKPDLGFVGWIPEVLKATDDEIFTNVGLDACTYLRAIRMGLKLALMGCCLCVFSVPTYYTSPHEEPDDGEPDGIKRLSNFNITDPLEKMSMGNTYFGDSRTFIAMITSWFLSIFGLYLLLKEIEWYTVYRHKYMRRETAQNYSVYVTGIPVHLRSEKALSDYLSIHFKGEVLETHLVKKVPKLEKMCAERDHLIDNLARHEHIFENSGKRPTKKTQEGVVDLIDKDSKDLAELKERIATRIAELEKEWREHDKKVGEKDRTALSNPPPTLSDTAFVSFKTISSTAIAMQISHNEVPFNLMVQEAPMPKHVVWATGTMTHWQKQGGGILAGVFTGATCLFWTIPMAFISTLKEVDELKKLGPSGCVDAGNCPVKVMNDHFALLDEILGVVAPLAILAVNYFLPVILGYYCTLEGHIGQNTFQASLFAKLTLFMIIQTFFVSAIAGSLFSQLDEFVDEPINKIQDILANSLPAQAVTFMSLIFVKTTYRLMTEMLRPRAAFYGWLRRFCGPRATPEERAKDYLGLSPFIWVLRPLTSPGPLKYTVLFADLVLMFTVLFVYSVLFPLSALFLFAAFFLLDVGYRNQMIYIYDPGNDTGGKLFINFAGYFMVSMIIAQITVFGVLSLSVSAAAPFMIPLIIITIVFWKYIKQQHFKIASTLPIGLGHEHDQEFASSGKELTFLKGAYVQKALVIPPEPVAPAKDPAVAADSKNETSVAKGPPEATGVSMSSSMSNSTDLSRAQHIPLAPVATPGNERLTATLQFSPGDPRGIPLLPPPFSHQHHTQNPFPSPVNLSHAPPAIFASGSALPTHQPSPPSTEVHSPRSWFSTPRKDVEHRPLAWSSPFIGGPQK